jgi:acyl carrier protein
VDRQKAFAVLREVVVEVLAVDPAAVTEDANFREELGADSLDLVEVVMSLEDQLGVRLPEDGLKGVTTVGEALDMVSDDSWIAHGA